MYSFTNLEPVYCSMSGSNYCFLTCIQISQEAGQVVWYSHLSEFSTVCCDPHSQRLLHSQWSRCFSGILLLFLFLKNFIFKLYNIVLVLPNIKMNPPQVYMCSPSWTLLPPPSSYHPSGLSQCTSPKHPVSCIESGLATRFYCFFYDPEDVGNLISGSSDFSKSSLYIGSSWFMYC